MKATITDPYDPEDVFQLNLSVDELGIIRYALGSLIDRGALIPRGTINFAENISDQLEALAQQFSRGEVSRETET